jgi:predicted membrane protein (TIGR00267 family)
MPQTPHIEKHFTSSETVRDIVIGMADGLTVPFALAAGLSGAVVASTVILTAGFAEIAAGSIAMGLGGYLAARSDAEHFVSERVREYEEIREKPEAEAEEVRQVFVSYGLTPAEARPVVEKPNPKRALVSASTIAGSYIAGGFIPLSPYILFHTAGTALTVSVVVTLIALTIFGYIKGHFTGTSPIRSAVQTALIGGVAAAAAFAIARAIS